MNAAEYAKMVADIAGSMEAITLSKRHDYADDEDVLQNFKRVRAMCWLLNIQPKESPADFALLMTVLKLDRYCNLRNKNAQPKNETIMDTVVDWHNYINLAFACDVDAGTFLVEAMV